MVVRREEGAAAHRVEKLLADGPGDGNPVEGARPPPHLVHDDEASLRRGVQDICRLVHLDEEGALAAGEIVLRPDAAEYLVHEPDPRRLGGHEGADVGHEGDEGGLPEHGGLAGHVRPRYEGEGLAAHVQVEVVRHEGTGGKASLDHGVPSLADRKQGLVREFRPAVGALGGGLREGSQAIDHGDQRGELLHRPYESLETLPHFQETSLFQLDYLLGRSIDLALDLGEPVGRVAFAGNQGLPPDEMRRDRVELALRHLQIEAYDLVVADAQRLDPGLAALLLEVLLEHLRRILLERAEPVEFGVVSLADQVALGEEHRGILLDRALDDGGRAGAALLCLVVDAGGEKPGHGDARGRRDRRRRLLLGEHRRNRQGGEHRILEREEILGVRLVHRQPGDEAVRIEHASQAPAQIVEEELIAVQAFHRVEALLYGGLVPERLQHPLPKEPRASGGLRSIERRKEGIPAAGVREIPHELQVLPRRLVQGEVLLAVERQEAPDMRAQSLGVLVQVLEQDARRRQLRRFVAKAEPLERGDAETPFERFQRFFAIEAPIGAALDEGAFHLAQDGSRRFAFEQRLLDDDLARRQAVELRLEELGAEDGIV